MILTIQGFYDGSVKLFDLREDKFKINEFVIDEGSATHTDPVWHVTWQENTLENHKCFYSTSSDGRVIQWILKKVVEEELFENKFFSFYLIFRVIVFE